MTQNPSSGAISRPSPVERVRDSRPDEEAWRADALAASRHSRWVDELRQPLDVHDQGRAQQICGEITRLALQDFAPALLLLPAEERCRLQAITAYSLTLFDFARQTGLEGERLTAINRWEFELEATLDGQPIGQPAFVLIHLSGQQRAWPREGFDLLHTVARRRSAQPRPKTRRAADRDAYELGKSLAWLFLGSPPAEPVIQLTSTLVGVLGLQNLGDDLRRHRIRFPTSEVPDNRALGADNGSGRLAVAISDECRRLSTTLEEGESLRHLPKNSRAATRYGLRSARLLLGQVETRGIGILSAPPQVSLLQRLRLLLHSRWL